MLAPATLAALPSTRAIETRSLPSSLAATRRGLAFYVAFPKSSIPFVATCSMSFPQKLHSLRRDVFYVTDPIRPPTAAAQTTERHGMSDMAGNAAR